MTTNHVPTNGDDPTSRPWRTQIVVETEVGLDGKFKASFPAWQCDDHIELDITDVPPDIRPHVRYGYRGYVKANIGEETPDRFCIDDWEDSIMYE